MSSLSQRQMIHGITADNHFLKLFNSPLGSGQIEQVFHQAVNFVVDNQLYTLLGSSLDNAPNSCRLGNQNFAALRINPGDPVQVSENTIEIGKDYVLSLALCQTWSSPQQDFARGKLTDPAYRLFLLNQLNRLDSMLTGRSTSLFNYQGDNPFYIAAATQLSQLRLSLIGLLADQQSAGLVEVIRQFIGLGIGLTPSGDDYLVGLMALLLLKNHPANTFYPDFYQGIMLNKANTTLLSAVTLEKALHREYRENLHQLIYSLVDAAETNIYPQMLAILNIGSSSGRDLLFGLRDAVYLTHYFGESYVD